MNKGFTLAGILISIGAVVGITAATFFVLHNSEEKEIHDNIAPTPSNYEPPLTHGQTPDTTSTPNYPTQTQSPANHNPTQPPSSEHDQEYTEEYTQPQAPPEHQTSSSTAIPTNLSLPFKISDIDNFNGEINPIGVVRFGLDQPEIGHSGLDVPLNQSANITAVADGDIIAIESANDP